MFTFGHHPPFGSRRVSAQASKKAHHCCPSSTPTGVPLGNTNPACVSLESRRYPDFYSRRTSRAFAIHNLDMWGPSEQRGQSDADAQARTTTSRTSNYLSKVIEPDGHLTT